MGIIFLLINRSLDKICRDSKNLFVFNFDFVKKLKSKSTINFNHTFYDPTTFQPHILTTFTKKSDFNQTHFKCHFGEQN